MSGLFRDQRVPRQSCGSCTGMGEVTQDDLTRWQNGDFSWSDWAWCKASPKALLVLVPFIGPALGVVTLFGAGRIPMHKNVPNVAVQAASVWPCLSEEAQIAANKKAADASATPAPPLPAPVDVIPELQLSQEKKKQIGLFAAAAVFIGLTILSKRKRSKR